MRDLAYIESLGALDWESAAGWAEVINQAAQGLTTGSSSGIASSVAQQALSEAGRWAADQPRVRVNRARGAALIDYGYDWIDSLEKWRPFIFTGSSLAAGAAGFTLWKRRKVPEAWMVYLPLTLLSGGLAWLLRPSALRPPPAPPPQTVKEPSKTLQQFLGWLDGRVQKLTVKYPGWEPRAYTQLAQDLGWSTIPPYVTGFLNRNAL